MTTSSTTNGKEIGINKPMPFTGDRKKVGTFVQEAKVYLTINRDVYNTDDKKIAFMLSYMTDKEALQWKELYLEALTDQTTGDIVFPSYAKFLTDLKEAFKAANRTLHLIGLFRNTLRPALSRRILFGETV